VALNLGGLTPAGKAAGWVVRHDNPMAYNNPGDTPVLGIVPLESKDITEPISISPISITLFKVPLR
jgi:hypothetical protein